MVSFGVHLELWNQFSTFVMAYYIIIPPEFSFQFFKLEPQFSTANSTKIVLFFSFLLKAFEHYR